MPGAPNRTAGSYRTPAQRPPRLRHYLLTFRSSGESASNRLELLESGKAASRLALDTVLRWVQNAGMEKEFGVLGEPTAFGMMGIAASPRLAKLLRKVPVVEDIIED